MPLQASHKPHSGQLEVPPQCLCSRAAATPAGCADSTDMKNLQTRSEKGRLRTAAPGHGRP
eukprot:3450188-Rhodomonas_salina.1